MTTDVIQTVPAFAATMTAGLSKCSDSEPGLEGQGRRYDLPRVTHVWVA